MSLSGNVKEETTKAKSIRRVSANQISYQKLMFLQLTIHSELSITCLKSVAKLFQGTKSVGLAWRNQNWVLTYFVYMKDTQRIDMMVIGFSNLLKTKS